MLLCHLASCLIAVLLVTDSSRNCLWHFACYRLPLLPSLTTFIGLSLFFHMLPFLLHSSPLSRLPTHACVYVCAYFAWFTPICKWYQYQGTHMCWLYIFTTTDPTSSAVKHHSNVMHKVKSQVQEMPFSNGHAIHQTLLQW